MIYSSTLHLYQHHPLVASNSPTSPYFKRERKKGGGGVPFWCMHHLPSHFCISHPPTLSIYEMTHILKRCPFIIINSCHFCSTFKGTKMLHFLMLGVLGVGRRGREEKVKTCVWEAEKVTRVLWDQDIHAAS